MKALLASASFVLAIGSKALAGTVATGVWPESRGGLAGQARRRPVGKHDGIGTFLKGDANKSLRDWSVWLRTAKTLQYVHRRA